MTLSSSQKHPSKNTPRLAQMDIHDLDIDTNGIKDYFWPITNSEHVAFGNDLMKAYVALIKKSGDDMAPEVIPYKLMAQYFVSEAVGLLQGDLLRERSNEANRKLVVPSSWRIWPYVSKKKTPPIIPILEHLRRGPIKPNYSKKVLNLKRLKKIVKLFQLREGKISLGGLKIKPITPSILKKSIVASQRTETITNHACNALEKEVIFCRSHKWFCEVKIQDLESFTPCKNNDLENSIFSGVEKTYLKNGIKLEEHSRAYLAKILQEGVSLLHVHYQRLLAMPEKLPKHIWTGSGGNVWDSMLRIAVMANGGRAEGHDHAMGQGVYGLSITPFLELWGADNFVTFNQAQIDGILSNKSYENVILDNKRVEIVSLEKTKNKESIKVFPRFLIQNPRIKTVALMATVYDCDRGRIAPVIPNIVSVDFQARLIAQLKRWGYNVIIKIHPESPILPPASFESNLGAKIISDRFEDMIDSIDMVLFDYIYTTTFRTVLETNIPVTIADYYGILWSPNVKNLINKRCSIVSGHYDEVNRAQMNWDKLRVGLNNASSKANVHDFACRYLQ